MEGSGKLHKHKNSLLPGELGNFYQLQDEASNMSLDSAAGAEESSLMSCGLHYGSPARRTSSRKLPSAALFPTSQRMSSSSQESLGSGAGSYADLSAAASLDTRFSHRGRLVKAGLSKYSFTWQNSGRGCCGAAPSGVQSVPFEEILVAQQLDSVLRCSIGACPIMMHRLVIHTFERSANKMCLWKPRKLVFFSQSAEVVRDWAAAVNTAVRQCTQRPKSLLVFLNPFGGARQALRVWQKVAVPIFDLAGARYQVVETERINHSRHVLEGLSLAELQSYDGVVAVGGDGLFQETLNGLLAIRSGCDERAAIAAKIRLGHIPAGSTDAVAYSLNGTRCQQTAALHVALGDRCRMDVMRIDSGDGARRFCVCVASYGYMGDLMRLSESMRFIGPTRYNLAGAFALFRNKSYSARITYLPAVSQASSFTAKRVCRARCELCAPTGTPCATHTDVFQPCSTPTDLPENGWVTVEGEFNAIMAVVMPCRSDRSDRGLAPFAHMADGRIHLILVRRCSALQYLRFLASIPQSGVLPENFDYVEAIDATAVRVEPRGGESCWSVDGELLENNTISARVFRGLVDVFGRGIE